MGPNEGCKVEKNIRIAWSVSKMIGAVVVLYNPTKNEIQNINLYKDKVDYTVIVDNSSEDNQQMIDSVVGFVSNIIYYSESINMGLAKGFNIGVNILKQQGCDWALLFDADSKIESDIISVYKKAIAECKRDVAVYSPVHIFERRKNKSYKGYREIDWAMTSGCLYNCEIFKEQKGFFEDLFVDGLDMDYCFKSHENGYKVIECGEAIIKHNPAETRNFFCFKYGIASPIRYYMQARQLIWCWLRYKKNKIFLIYLLLM